MFLSWKCFSKILIKTVIQVTHLKKFLFSVSQSGFVHFSMYGIKREMLNVHISNSTEVEDRQESCNFTIFLQHTNGLSDRQEISIVARLQLEKSFSDSNTTIERRLTYYARTTILVIFCDNFISLSCFFFKKFKFFKSWKNVNW